MSYVCTTTHRRSGVHSLPPAASQGGCPKQPDTAGKLRSRAPPHHLLPTVHPEFKDRLLTYSYASTHNNKRILFYLV